MSKSCKGLAMELVKCLSESDCVKVEKRSYRECAGEKSPSISSECVGLRETYFNCKRGQASLSLSPSLPLFLSLFFHLSRLCRIVIKWRGRALCCVLDYEIGRCGVAFFCAFDCGWGFVPGCFCSFLADYGVATARIEFVGTVL